MERLVSAFWTAFTVVVFVDLCLRFYFLFGDCANDLKQHEQARLKLKRLIKKMKSENKPTLVEQERLRELKRQRLLTWVKMATCTFVHAVAISLAAAITKFTTNSQDLKTFWLDSFLLFYEHLERVIVEIAVVYTDKWSLSRVRAFLIVEVVLLAGGLGVSAASVKLFETRTWVLVSCLDYLALQICKIVRSSYSWHKTTMAQNHEANFHEANFHEANFHEVDLVFWSAGISGIATCASTVGIVVSYQSKFGRPSQIIFMILWPSLGELILIGMQILRKHTRENDTPTLNSRTGTQKNLNAGVTGDRTFDLPTAPETPANSRSSSFDVEKELPDSLAALSHSNL